MSYMLVELSIWRIQYFLLFAMRLSFDFPQAAVALSDL